MENNQDSKREYHYPTNSEEWWDDLYAHWDDILNIILRFCPNKAEEALRLKIDHDRDIYSILNLAWWNAPDSPSIHEIPSWYVLCDLCSEAYCLYGEEEFDDE